MGYNSSRLRIMILVAVLISGLLIVYRAYIGYQTELSPTSEPLQKFGLL
jgi:hypothetical protein